MVRALLHTVAAMVVVVPMLAAHNGAADSVPPSTGPTKSAVVAEQGLWSVYEQSL